MQVLVKDGAVVKFPYSAGELRRDNPRTSFPRVVPPALLQEYGVFHVTQSDKPPLSKTQTVDRENAPTLSGGRWVLGWVVRDKTASEIEQDRQIAKAECRKRIFAVIDQTAQMNLAAAAAADALSADDLATYKLGLEWISAMRAAWPTMPDTWPEVPAGVAELAARF